MTKLLEEYMALCELHIKTAELMREYYRHMYAERNAIKQIKWKYRKNDCYKKWSSQARRIARKNMNRSKGQRCVVDHIKPLLLCFLEGMSPEEASNVSNLEIMSRAKNKRKSYLLSEMLED